MILALTNETHPEAEILLIDIEHKAVTFRNIDGVCGAPLVATKGDVPTALELQASIEAVLGEEEKEIN